MDYLRACGELDFARLDAWLRELARG